MGRFQEADQSVYDLMEDLMIERMPHLREIHIKILMDSKAKIDKLRGAMVFASIKTTNHVEQFLSKDGHHLGGFDYIMFIHELPWELASDEDKKRIISHELRHCFIDEKGKCKTVKHDIEDFYAEVELNQDDQAWGSTLSTIAMAKYEQMKEEDKMNR
jgi:hypothetical protein